MEKTVRMTFPNERAFEDHLRDIIASRITSEIPSVYALEHKTVGDIVIMRDGTSPAMFFLEVKYFQLSKGRLGVGTGSGGGIQPEMLKRRPAYLETNLRWVLASDSHSSKGYWFVTSAVVCQYVAGGAIGTKQNNIQKRLFRQHPSIDNSELVDQLKRWLVV